MKVALLLFTYNRSYHTEQVVNALVRNTVLPEKLFVFQDGKRHDGDDCEWEKVNKLIRTIDWCDKEIIISEYNKGLANSIVSGINYVFQEYDAIIVLEDDCVPTSNFMNFMCQCLKKYQNNKKVFTINGYSYPVMLEKKQYDVYGGGTIGTWGWATWKDRWDIYKRDYELIKKMRQEEATSRNLARWGSDLEEMVVGNVRGTHDSWAVFWALNVIEKEGICVNPYESFIRNIGMDGTGVHCGITEQYNVTCIDEKKSEFMLPEEIVILDEAIEAYVPLCGSYTALTFRNELREKVLVYGLGNFYLQNEKAINEKYNLLAFIDKYKCKHDKWYAGKRIISMNEIGEYNYDRIIVTVWSIAECRSIVRELINYGVNPKKIMLCHDFLVFL